MKKILLTIVATGTLLSADPCYFVGLDVGKIQFEHEQNEDYDLSGWSWNNTRANAINLNAGAYLDDHSRLYANFSNANLNDANYKSLGLGFDYLYGDRDFQPFIGVIAGYSILDYEASSMSNDYGFYYGLQAGVSYDIGILSVETGFRHALNTLSRAGHNQITNTAYNMELESFSGWFIGIKHLF